MCLPQGPLPKHRGHVSIRGYSAAHRDREIAVAAAAGAEGDVDVDVAGEHLGKLAGGRAGTHDEG